MEDRNQYDDILVRYLFNEETREEKIFVETWLNQSGENRAYFNSLKKVWQLTQIKQELDELSNETVLNEKWNRFQKNVAEKRDAKLIPLHPEALSENESAEKSYSNGKSGLRKWLIPAGVAASLLLLVGLGWKYLGNKSPAPALTKLKEQTSDSIQYVIRHEVNTNLREKKITLPDSSEVLLAANSEITFKEPFGATRDITIVGKAWFKVSHDANRPFTVTSGDISTTALGTQFTVTAFSNAKQITVHLYEGKVVVKPVDKFNRRMNSDVYLLPGQAFVYTSEIAVVKKFTVKKNLAPEALINQEQAIDNPSIPKSSESSWYMFNNQALPQVFDQLSRMFNVQIVYDKKEIQNMYFIGRYKNSDSLQIILERISKLNNLRVTKADNRIIITK